MATLEGTNGNDNLEVGWEENVFGYDGDDTISLNPFTDRIYHADGGKGTDILNVDFSFSTHAPGSGGFAYSWMGFDANAGDASAYHSEDIYEWVYDPDTGEVSYEYIYHLEEYAGVSFEGFELFNVTGTFASDSIVTGAGNDTLSALSGDDHLDGGAGNDSLNGGAGADTMIGGTGNDTYVVDTVFDVITETSAVAAEIDLVQSSISCTLGANLENLTLLGTAAVNGTGNALANFLTGNGARNILHGGDGNDSIDGGSGNDALIGGTGNDKFFGADGNDYLDGGEGGDYVHGGTGADTLIGGTGNDTYVVDNSGDIVSEMSTAAVEIDLVLSRRSYTLGARLENLTLFGTATIDGTGNALANKITGNSGNNKLDGGAGNDSLSGGVGHDGLNGGAGKDTLAGGAGNDTYVVDTVFDVIIETSTLATEIDLVQSSITHALGVNLENLTLTGSANSAGTGNALANKITGNRGNNRLSGGDGNDILTGASAATFGVGELDTLTGGVGDDRFVLGNSAGRFYDDGSTATAGTVDYAFITGFTARSDRLQLDGTAANYYLGASPVAGVSGSALFYENGAADELVAIIKSGNSTTLTAANTINTAAFV
ncbi:MAG TPA: calcium-binding protein [Chthoniobacterales bacterium]